MYIRDNVSDTYIDFLVYTEQTGHTSEVVKQIFGCAVVPPLMVSQKCFQVVYGRSQRLHVCHIHNDGTFGIQKTIASVFFSI